MTTLNLAGITADARRALNNNGLARVAGRHRRLSTPIADALVALTAAIGGSEDTPDVDVSALNRRDLSAFVRLVESAIQHTPNPGPLKRFVADLVAADAAANPNALPLRTA